MQKPIYKLLLFLSILLVLLCSINWFISMGIQKTTYAHYGKIKKILKHDNLPQIAIFSSSVGEMGFDSRAIQTKTNKSVYNFSLRGTRFMQYRGFIDEVNTANNNIDIVVLAETIFALEDVKALTELEVYLPTISNDNVYNSLYKIQPDLVFKSRYIPFYKYIAVSDLYYRQSLSTWKNIIKHKLIPDTALGHIAIKTKWENGEDSILKYTEPIPIIIDENVVATYKKLVQQLVANGKKVVITIPPIYLPKSQKILDMTQLRNTLSSIADNKKIFFWDFSEAMVDKKYFYNVLHLNAFGAKTFSNTFADSLNNKLLNK